MTKARIAKEKASKEEKKVDKNNESENKKKEEEIPAGIFFKIYVHCT